MKPLIFIIIFFIAMWQLYSIRHDRNLTIIMFLLSLPLVGFILNRFLPITGIYHFSMLGLLLGLALFCFRLYKKQSPNKSVNRIYQLMMIPVVGLFINWFFKFGHYPGAYLVQLGMFIPIGIGVFLVVQKIQLEEHKALNLVLLYLILDIIFLLG